MKVYFYLICICAISVATCDHYSNLDWSRSSNYNNVRQNSNPWSSIITPSFSSPYNYGLSNLLDIGATLHDNFQDFLTSYGKNYTFSELPRRMSLFSRAKSLVQDSLNSFNHGQQSYALTLNEFSDWDENEIESLKGVKLGTQQLQEIQSVLSRPVMVGASGTETIPAIKDWRKSGCISTPINQKQCGCCWAVSSIGVVEAKSCLARGEGAILSIQQLIDCATPRAGYRNNGCNGGWPTEAMNYIYRSSDLMTRQTCYPLVFRQNSCKSGSMSYRPGCSISSGALGTRSYKTLKGESEILYHVAKTGPVVAVIEATRRFVLYSRGIFDDFTCNNRPSSVDHGIQIVGYGTEGGVDYWLIKNSWGTSWGEGGFGKVRRGKNACSIGHIGWVAL